MKTPLKQLLMFCLIFFLNTIFIKGQDLNENLSILKPFLNKSWEGKLKAPDGSAEFKVVRNYQIILNGNAIKCTKSNIDLKNEGEGYFYWDDISKKVACFFIENGGVFYTGFVSNENNTIIIEGKISFPTQANPRIKQSFEFKNTFDFPGENKMTDCWFQNAFGPWRPGHTIEFIGKI